MTAGTHTYVAFTLRISSPIRLPGLPRTDTNGEPQVTIDYGHVDPNEVDEVASSSEIRLDYDHIGAFEIRDGKRVVVDPVSGLSAASLLPYVLGPVMGAVLHQRGYLVLHASSVSIRDTAVAFLGSSGAGKSTLAAACRAMGHDMLSDDITAIDIVDGRPLAVPGGPWLKLSPELADKLDIGEEGPSMDEGGKSLYHIPSESRRSPPPLEHLYVLSDGELHCQRLRPGETVQALVGHTYTQSMLDETSIGSHFHQCACVAEAAEISRLTRPRDFDVLPDTVRLIERQVAR